jgi:hypothetical protein
VNAQRGRPVSSYREDLARMINEQAQGQIAAASTWEELNAAPDVEKPVIDELADRERASHVDGRAYRIVSAASLVVADGWVSSHSLVVAYWRAVRACCDGDPAGLAGFRGKTVRLRTRNRAADPRLETDPRVLRELDAAGALDWREWPGNRLSPGPWRPR